MNNKLIFVYNADSGMFNTVTDIAHKILSPKTYSCNLCAITHSYFSVKENWADFLEGFPVECEFLHKDEFINAYPNKGDVPLPAIFESIDGQVAEKYSMDEINNCQSIDELKSLITSRV